MKRRLFIKNATSGLLAASTAALLPSMASAAEMMQQKQQLRTAPKVQMQQQMMVVNFKGISFKATSQQKSAFSRLPTNIRNRLKPPRKGGKVLSVKELNDIRTANAILQAHGEKTMSTIMCPW